MRPFGVSYGYSQKMRRQQLRSGQRARVELRRQPDLTRAELGERLRSSPAINRPEVRDRVFLDESGVTTEITRRYGRALPGERVREGYAGRALAHPHSAGDITTAGLLATMTIESPTDADILLAYLEQVLCPRLRPGQGVVMDNLSAHKHPAVRPLVEHAGAQLLYLQPYVTTAIATVTPHNAIAWFRHCGYLLSDTGTPEPL